ncbi:MAG: AraC family transcriptional regulator [Deltaproteobacteria bacterium]|nr:MAG: AraC family transcriptional regulator [Deltaproteobacteria bacterium]
MSQFVHFENLAQIYDFIGRGEPTHPLITIIRRWPQTGLDVSQYKFTSALYFMTLKNYNDGALKYGRSTYDYQKGTMVFVGPGQVVTFAGAQQPAEDPGWTVLFHPDLLRGTSLEQSLRAFSFFDYDLSEALHLSQKERDYLNVVLDQMEQELNQNIDRHSMGIVVHHLETILRYSHRYYERQFYIRTSANKDRLVQFESYLKDHFNSPKLLEDGIPTVEQCGKALNMSPSYLSDLLRAETGKSAKAHIHSFLIDEAKSRLLGSDQTVAEVAYSLGFDYPQHFSKLFKTKTGMSPSDYRKLN